MTSVFVSKSAGVASDTESVSQGKRGVVLIKGACSLSMGYNNGGVASIKWTWSLSVGYNIEGVVLIKGAWSLWIIIKEAWPQ